MREERRSCCLKMADSKPSTESGSAPSTTASNIKAAILEHCQSAKLFMEAQPVAAAAVGAVLVVGGIFLLSRKPGKSSGEASRSSSSEGGADGETGEGIPQGTRGGQPPGTPNTKQEKKEAETKLIGEYILICRQMLVKQSAGNISHHEIEAFNERRRLIVHTLHSIGGEEAVQRLNDGLANAAGPPPPPPEPKELLNQKLVYRMMTDKDYKMKKKKLSALENHIVETTKRAFWDGKRAQVLAGDYQPLMAEIVGLMQRIPEACTFEDSGKDRLRLKLSQLIDIDFVQAQIKDGVYGIQEIQGLVNQIYSVLIKRQSPQRDEESSKFHENAMGLLSPSDSGVSDREIIANAMQPIIEGLHEIMENIRLDLTNYLMNSTRAALTNGEAGIKKERDIFQRRLDMGEVTLSSSKVWIARSIEIELTRGFVTKEGLAKGDAATFRKLLRAACCDICLLDASQMRNGVSVGGASAVLKLSPPRKAAAKNGDVDSKVDMAVEIPEILEVESEDIKMIWLQLREVVESANMIMKAKAFLGVQKIRLKGEEFKQMHEFLHEMNAETEEEKISPYGDDGRYSLLTVSDPYSEKGRARRLESAAALVATAYERAKRVKLPEEKRKFLLDLFMQMKESDGSKDPTYPIFHKILRRTIKEVVNSSMAVIDASAHIEKALAKKNIGECAGSVMKIVSQIKKITDHNLLVHGKTYNSLIKFVYSKMKSGMV